MRAWIARDDNGHTMLFFDNPEMEGRGTGDGGYWTGDIFVAPKGSASEIAEQIGLTNGHKQQIELIARPIGEAEGGAA